MSDADPSGSVTGSAKGEERERGARRKKVYGYLKAANELRHTFQSQRVQHDHALEEDGQGVPGAFPDVEIVRSGDEEMVLFPSYARKHFKKSRVLAKEIPRVHGNIAGPDSSGDAEYWKKEWENYEDDNAIVDVDVRGWIYSPHRGPMTRRNRLLIAVARRLSGIPAPAVSPGNSRGSSRHSTIRNQFDERRISNEEEIVEKEAQSILQRGEGEADAAWRGNYSEVPGRTASPHSSRPPSPIGRRDALPGHISRQVTEMSMGSDNDDPSNGSMAKRELWNKPSAMSKEELQIANAHLMARLKPFMTIPLANAPITVFFFNEHKSQSRSINTDDSGHFSVRASLDFSPSSVRVLASESLSASEEVIVTESRGISLVSDIDDTIKHSAIASGAKEIFKNTFIRDLTDLTIQGVKEWYSRLFAMGVKLHYVSNSPWQLYPLLRTYFALAGLPPGSFHLKQYSGMLQGIFEPAAERKKGSLEKIMRDFPERRFILVGDSGEADLEVYTDIVIANPGRVLGVFIRDVTTGEKKRFFDQTVEHLESDLFSAPRKGNLSSTETEDSDAAEDRKSLPNRGPQNNKKNGDDAQSRVDKLIEFEEGAAEIPGKQPFQNADLLELQQDDSQSHTQPPNHPEKPSAWENRSTSDGAHSSTQQNPVNANSQSETDKSTRKSGRPPKPRRPSTSVNLPSAYAHSQPTHGPLPSEQRNQARPALLDRAASSSSVKLLRGTAEEDGGYTASARRQLVSAYNNLPIARSLRDGRNSSPGPSRSTNGSHTPPSHHSTGPDWEKPAIPLRTSKEGIAANLASYPVAAAQSLSNRIAWGTPTSGGGLGAGNSGATAGLPYNKKEEMWKRRWGRAEELMRRHRVVLRSWRVGGDVMEECVRLVEKSLEDIHRKEAGKESRKERGNRRQGENSS